MSPDPTKRPGPEVRHTLLGVRQTLRRYLLLQTSLIILCWLLFAFWFGGLVDYLPVTLGSDESPRWLRFTWLVIMGLGTAWTVFVWCLPRLFARLPNRSLALMIERRYPQLNNELITAVELSDLQRTARASSLPDDAPEPQVSNPAAYDQMLERVHHSLQREIRQVDPASLFDWQPVWAALLSVTLSLVLTGLAWFAMPDWLSLWSQRLFALSDAKWPRQAELRAHGVQVQLPAFSGQLAAERSLQPFVEGVARVPRGSTTQLQISARAEEKRVPEVCTLFYRGEDGGRGRANLRRIGTASDGWQQFVLDGPPLDGLGQNLSIDIVGLDARLRNLQLFVVDPAVVTEVVLECEYPQYLQSLTQGAVDRRPYRSGITVPEGTRVRLAGRSNARLQEVQYVVQGEARQSAGGEEATSSEQRFEIRTTAPARSADQDSEFFIALNSLTANHVVEVRLIDEYGLSSEQVPRYLIGIQPDSVPEVSSQLAGIGRAITPQAILPIEGTIADDHEIAAVTLELLKGSQGAPVVIDLPMPADEELATQVDLVTLRESGQFSVEPGETISLVVAASDFYDLAEEPHVGRGQPQQLAVVTADELLVMLDRQELEMRQRLEIIISELEQLRSVVQDLAIGGTSQSAHLRELPTVLLRPSRAPQTDEDDEAAAVRTQRMATLKAQQSVLQGDKSEQELLGVALGVVDLRQQLTNNRIDSYDRQERLQAKVYEPLMSLLEQEYPRLTASLEDLQTASMQGAVEDQAGSALTAADDVLVKLLEIKENMLDIESFNEIIDLVRGLLEDQDQLLDATEKAKRARILDLLN